MFSGTTQHMEIKMPKQYILFICQVISNLGTVEYPGQKGNSARSLLLTDLLV